MAASSTFRAAMLLFLFLLQVCTAFEGVPGEAEGLGVDHDDECVADGGDPSCALGAFQLRAHRKAALLQEQQEKAQLEKAKREKQPPLPPGDDIFDDLEDDDEEAGGDAGAQGGQSGAGGSEEVKPYGQCGGGGWTGSTNCGAGGKCVAVDQYYAQCVPASEVKNAEEQAKRQQEERKNHAKADKDDDEDGFQEPLAAQKAPKKMPKVAKAPKPVTIKGNFLYSLDGSRFFAKGVAYNPRNLVFDKKQMKGGNCTPGEPPVGKLSYAADPTADELEGTWKEALNAMAYMGANTVRLYNIDPEQSHKKFMEFAASLGLYVIVPLTRHDWGFLPAGMPSPSCYSSNITGYGNVGTNLLTSAKLIVKEFSQYDNTLLFTVANEMTVEFKDGYGAFPCVKALTRDIHQYQAQCGATMRRVPLIYADMDTGPPYREVVAQYLACELESADDAVDAYGLNVYSWCDSEYPDETGTDSFQFSPYSPIRDEFETFSKPMLFTEFGCNLGEFATQCPYKGGRTWPDVSTFFNQFKEIMSGAVAFEFSMEDNQYGLALSPGFTSDEHNAEHFYYLDTFYALRQQFVRNNVSSAWDGADIGSCSWKPSEASAMSSKHKPAVCPKKGTVAAMFKDKGLSFQANWDSLPPTPEGADQDALAECPKYKVDPVLRQEACCHQKCDS